MKSIRQTAISLVTSLCILAAACEYEPPNTVSNTNSAPAAAAPTEPSGTNTNPSANANDWAVTLPVLDAFLSDQTFANDLKTKLQLSDQQVARLREISRDATHDLRRAGREEEEYGTSIDLRERTQSQVTEVIGQTKTTQLFTMVAERWNGNGATSATASTTAPSGPHPVPVDSRIVVNTPAFRMDVFEDGRLVKSYRIGIGYPEFPLPTGLRTADSIIFNPSWTPPDEPWVQKVSRDVKAGETVKPGDKENPLGLLKIPIGLPSLIHGGKAPAKLGTFASHGCIGLTDLQAKDLAKVLARLGGVELTDDQITRYRKNKTETRTVKLSNPIPVELRYETIVVEDGKLRIYRDVYDRNRNTEQNLRAALEAHGITIDQLSAQERAQVMNGLAQMSRDMSGRPDSADMKRANSNTASMALSTTRSKKAERKKSIKDSIGMVTRVIRGPKEVVIEIAALRGKGYPAPVALDPGVRAKRARRGGS